LADAQPKDNAMSIALSRRSLVTGAAALTALPIPAAATKDDARIERLWIERTRIASEMRAIARASREARGKMPEWAANGPMYLKSDGTYGGPIVGRPRKDDCRLPQAGAIINVRPSAQDIRKDFDLYVSVYGPRARKAAWEVYKKRVAQFNERCRQQKLLEQALGLPSLEKRSDGLMSRLFKIDKAIEEAATSPTKAATLFMIELQCGRTNVGLENADVCLLSVLRPHLTGLIALHVDDLIRHPSIPIEEREFCEA
jgi:hypothetical protein